MAQEQNAAQTEDRAWTAGMDEAMLPAAGGAGGRPAQPSAPSGASKAQHFAALMRKNSLLKRRQWGSASCCAWCPLAACCELVLPVAVLVLLWWARSEAQKSDTMSSPVLAGWGGVMPEGDRAIQCQEGLPLDNPSAAPVPGAPTIGHSSCYSWLEVYERPLPFYKVLSYLYWSDKKLVLAADHGSDIPKVEQIRDFISTKWHPDIAMADIPCVDLEKPIIDLSKAKNGGEPTKPTLRCKGNSSSIVPTPDKPHGGVLPSFANLTTVLTNQQFEDYITSEDYGSASHPPVYGAVVFHSIGGDGGLGAPGNWKYSIRLNVSDATTPFTQGPRTIPLRKKLETREASTYLAHGFTSIQLLMDRYIIGHRGADASTEAVVDANGVELWKFPQNPTPDEQKLITAAKESLAESLRYAPQAVGTVPFPVAGLLMDTFFSSVAAAFPIVFIVAFMYTQKCIINELIVEKESKVRESLRMLGVTSLSIIGAWFITYGIVFAVLCLIFGVVAHFVLFTFSDASLLFLFFWLWSMSFVSFAWFVHAFFNKARVGGIVGIILMFTQWIVYVAVNQPNNPATSTELVLLMLMPNGAFCAGLGMIAKFEEAKEGATWANLFLPVSDSYFGLVLLMLIVNTGIWTFLGWYLDRVLPKEFGVRLPPHFLFLPSYWKSDAGLVPEAASDEGQVLEEQLSFSESSRTIEAVPAAIKASSQASGCYVHIKKLRRAFKTPGGEKVAVASLDLSMYAGQIFALLGHNGAGKTTTINMLTGMIAPTSGDADIAGHSILTGMTSIRRIIGVCPQHDVLWQELTVGEHLRIFARLRGVPKEDIEGRCQEMLQEVGLTEKVVTRAGSLSGGQKRKLSLCLALIGQPRVCFLDEPTSGMDPFSRRSTWGMIRGIREGRVTVLTTHFMDEADILGDRIAIMAEGRLQCCGSAFFLKHRFGAGYKLTCARTVQSANGNGAAESSGQQATGGDICAVIQKHVADAELLTDVSAEVSMRLPMTSTSKFPSLFRELDGSKAALNLSSYGLSMVTLEEVFLKIASGEFEDREEADAPGEAAPSWKASAQPQPSQPADASGSNAVVPLLNAESELSVPARSWRDRQVEEQEGEVQQSPPQTQQQQQQLQLPPMEGQSELRVSCRHYAAMYRKRWQYGRRDAKAVCCTVLLPVAWLAFGLWLLQTLSHNIRNSPSIVLSPTEFGVKPSLPYNSTSGTGVWSNPSEVSSFLKGMKPQPTSVPLPEGGNGHVFGLNYSDGLPQFNLCEDPAIKPGPLSKCFRQEHLCDLYLPVVQGLDQLGLRIGCDTDADKCEATFKAACDHGGAQCERLCMQHTQSGQKLPKQLCKKQCDTFCQSAGSMETIFCGALRTSGVKFAAFCPVTCASKDDPSTCDPGTKCPQEKVQGLADPAATLAFERVLFKDGQGTKHDNVVYGAVQAGSYIHNSSLQGLQEDWRSAADKNAVQEVMLLYNTSALDIVPVLLNLVSGTLKRSVSGSDSSITVMNSPMPMSKHSDSGKVVSAVINLFSCFVVIQAFSFVPAAIVAYIVREREAHHNSKHQQLISGVGVVPYWFANLSWDITVYFLPLGLSLLFIWAYGVEVFTRGNAFPACFVTMLGYGLAITPFSYLLSFLFSKHTTAQVLCLVANFVTGLLLVQISQILSLIDSTRQINDSLMWLFRLFPGFGLGHGLLMICENSVLVGTLGMTDDVNLFGWDVAGEDILYLYASAPVYFILAVIIDYLLHSPIAAVSRYADPAGTAAEEEVDSDVQQEAERVLSGAADADVVRLVQLRKVYRTPEGKPKYAVKGLSFGLPLGECFGFLGINGAGKTSTLNMLTGAILPSSGQAFLGGFDVVRQQWQCRRLMGYCPQHDALLDRLTVQEHLRLFGSIKGIRSAELMAYCDTMMENLSLQPHVHKLAKTLSGGNKRKLSLAISMMGCPQLIFLDEPSTGVDPAARRLMWNVISGASTEGQSSTVVLTTHNMEEAEALCSRIGIMVGGRLRCIGSNQHLKARFGNGYQLEARLRCLSTEEIKAAVLRMELPGQLNGETVVATCARLGDAGRAQLVRADCEEGRSIFEALERSGFVEDAHFAEWWLLEEAARKLQATLTEGLPGLRLLERHGRSLRFHFPTLSLSLSEVFRHLESCRNDQRLVEDYGVSQTSLEQIFNNFAAQQEEETGPVRGMYSQ